MKLQHRSRAPTHSSGAAQLTGTVPVGCTTVAGSRVCVCGSASGCEVRLCDPCIRVSRMCVCPGCPRCLTGRTFYTRTEVPYYTEVTTEAPLSHSWPLNTWPECPRNQEEDTHCGCTSASIRCGKSRDVCMCGSRSSPHTHRSPSRGSHMGCHLVAWVVTWSSAALRQPMRLCSRCPPPTVRMCASATASTALSSLLDVSEKYDAFLLDQFGVIHGVCLFTALLATKLWRNVTLA